MTLWKPVVGWEGWYEVSTLGEVRSVTRLTTVVVLGKPQQRLIRGKMLRPGATKGYKIIAMSKPGQRPRTYLVHVLVAAAFIGPTPPGMEVCHYDGVRDHNWLSNLEYGTRSKNALDRHRHGTMNQARGEEHFYHKLTEAKVRAIRRSAASTYALAEVYGVHHSAIWAARVGKTWKHVRNVLSVA